MKYTYRQIIDSLPKTKNSKSSWWVKLWVRKLSFIFTFLFINIGFSSNAVSYLSILVTLTSCVLFCIPNTVCIWIAVVLINFWLVLDCVDGNIARCIGKKKNFGEFIDAMGGYVTVAFIYLALGVAAYNNGGVIFQKSNMLLIIIGAVASISDILARLIYTNFCNAEISAFGKNTEKKDTDKKGTLNYLRKRISKELGLSGMFMPLTIAGAIFGCYDVIVLFYCLFNGFALASTMFIYAYKAEKYDK